MRYYDTATRTEINQESETTIASTDDRVKDFFNTLPAGHKLEFTEDGLPLIVKVPSPTQAELDAQAKEIRKIEIDARLKEIDFESVRPLRAISNGTQVQADIDKLSNLDTEAESLRTERATLI